VPALTTASWLKLLFAGLSPRRDGSSIQDYSLSDLWGTQWQRNRFSPNIPAFPLMDRDSSVGIATRYRLDGPGIESRWGEIFRTRLDRPCGPLSLLYNGYRGIFLGGKAAGAWRWPPTPSRTSWPVIGWNLPLPLPLFPLPPVIFIPPMPHTYLHLHIALTKRTIGWSLWSFQKANNVRNIGEYWVDNYYHLIFGDNAGFIFQVLSQSCEASFVISVCLSVRMEQFGSHWTDFRKIW